MNRTFSKVLCVKQISVSINMSRKKIHYTAADCDLSHAKLISKWTEERTDFQ